MAAAAIGSRAVKSPVARRQVASSLSSFVKALLDRGSGNFKGLPRPQVDKRASAKLSCGPTAVAPSGISPQRPEIHDRPGSATREDFVVFAITACNAAVTLVRASDTNRSEGAVQPKCRLF